jgi:hypothetical protein
MLGTLLLPCLALVVWAYYADPAPEQPLPVPCKERPEEAEAPFTDEHEHGTVFDIPEQHEAVRQILEVMEGEVTLCAVCKGQADALYRVDMVDDSAFCCSVCAEMIRARRSA